MSYMQKSGLGGAATEEALAASTVHFEAMDAAGEAARAGLLSTTTEVLAVTLDVSKKVAVQAASVALGVALPGSISAVISAIVADVVAFAVAYVVPVVTAIAGAAAGSSLTAFLGGSALAVAQVTGVIGTVAWPVLAVAVVALIVAGILTVCADDAEEETKRWIERAQSVYSPAVGHGKGGAIRPCDVLIASMGADRKANYRDTGFVFAVVESTPGVPDPVRIMLTKLRRGIETSYTDVRGGEMYWPVYIDLIASQFRNGAIRFTDVIFAYLNYTRPNQGNNWVAAQMISYLYDAQVDKLSKDPATAARAVIVERDAAAALFSMLGPEMELCSSTPIWGGERLAVDQRHMVEFIDILKNWNAIASKKYVKADLAKVRAAAEKAIKVADLHKVSAAALLRPAVVTLHASTKGVSQQANIKPVPKPAPKPAAKAAIVRDVAVSSGGGWLAVGLLTAAASLGGIVYLRKHPGVMSRLRSRLTRG